MLSIAVNSVSSVALHHRVVFATLRPMLGRTCELPEVASGGLRAGTKKAHRGRYPKARESDQAAPLTAMPCPSQCCKDERRRCQVAELLLSASVLAPLADTLQFRRDGS